MLALVFSVLFALYLLGPDLLARWLLGFVVPRKALVQSRSEEVTRAAIWAVFPFLIAMWGVSRTGSFIRNGGWPPLRVFFAGLYSETQFRMAPEAWFQSASVFLRINLALLSWLYGAVFATSVLLAILTVRYAPLRRLLPEGWMRRLLARVILPRVAEWHVLLSDMLLPSRDLVLFADVLTRSGLYSGRVQDKVLGPDGSLRSITLGEPRRFDREPYLSERERAGAVDAAPFWRDIPGNLFVIVGGEVLNLNLRYVAPPDKAVPTTPEEKLSLQELLADLPQA